MAKLNPPKSSPSKSRPPEPKSHWLRNFYLIACLAFVGFVCFRIFFSPKEITDRVRVALDRQRSQLDIRFQEASLSLADSLIPQLAIEMRDVSFARQQSCPKSEGEVPGALIPAVHVARMQIPFRFWRLLMGHVEAGDVQAEDVMIDLDRLKEPCGPRVHVVEFQAPVSVMADILDPKRGAAEPVPAHPWWTDQQMESLRHILSGVNFHRVQLKFETHRDGGKEVYLQNFEMQLGEAGDAKPVRLRSYLKVPPAMTYGETLPAIAIDGDANSNAADLKLRADLSEGSIETVARLIPSENGGIRIEAHANVSDLPLSTTMPLLQKAGIIRRTLKPKFLWLNCGVSIAGQFQGLFESEPLHFEKCSIVGSGADVQLAQATREANGDWQPFQLKVRNLDLRKIFDTFEAKGPDGVASEYGRLTGKFEFRNSKMIDFKGDVEGAALHFSNQKLRAIQTVNRMSADVRLNGTQMRAQIYAVDLANGNFKGELNLEGDSEFRKAVVKLNVESLGLDPSVQRILVNGEIGSARGRGQATILDGRLSAVEGDWFLDSMDGRDFKLKMARVQTKFNGETVRLQLKAPFLTLNRESAFFTSLRPLFFAHQFQEPWVEVHEPVMSAVFSKDHGIDWEKVTGTMIDGQLKIATAGHLSEDQMLDGWVAADYPRAKKLRWRLAGGVTEPKLAAEVGRPMSDLLKRGPVSDLSLGIQKQ